MQNSHFPAQQQHPQHPHPHPQQQPGQMPGQVPPGQPFYQYQQYPQQTFAPHQMQQQQFAQWAYQNMMFNAQQQHQLGAYPLHAPIGQPPPFDPRLQMNPQQQMQLAQMHQQQMAAMQQHQQHQHQPPQPPYAREANGSRSSLHSSNSSSRSQDGTPRRRTTSGKSGPPPALPSSSNRSPGGVSHQGRSLPTSKVHQRVTSTGSHGSSASAPSPAAAALAAVAARSQSQTPSSSGASTPLSSPSGGSANGANSAASRHLPKPSPLSQGSGSASPSTTQAVHDEGDLTDTPTSHLVGARPSGLKGRLRRALSFSAVNTLETTNESSEEKLGSRRKVVAAKLTSEGQTPVRSTHQPRPSTDSTSTMRHRQSTSQEAPAQSMDIDPSIRSATVGKKKGRSLFNSKFNASTDNISLSSTVSSASMMIRKLGSVGQLARRNSLMKISNLFKDKEKKKAEAEAAGASSDGAAEAPKGKGKDKSKKTAKGEKAEASVTHATVELERGANGGTSDDMVGLSPAAKLARQHTLRSKAQEAARARAEKEAKEKAGGEGSTPTTWEKNTASRAAARRRLAGQQGQEGPSDEDDLEGSDEDNSTFDGHDQAAVSRQQPGGPGYRGFDPDGDDSDSDQDNHYGYGDEDATVIPGQAPDMDEPWAVGLRRSVERTRTPSKGILKYADTYDQSLIATDPPQAPFTRTRSNSCDSAPPNGAEPGPLARIPSPDPDHIDGLHHRGGSDGHHRRSSSTSSAKPAFLPPLNFDDSGSSTLGSALSFDDCNTATEKSKRDSTGSGNFPYQQPSFNASAPTLTSASTLAGGSANIRPATLAQRSATAPLALNSRKLTFAANLSVYHTFSPAVYDRRSEPATCNRLTPALAQRIKEELNSYKMEEMEVHHLSRAHTHFFV